MSSTNRSWVMRETGSPLVKEPLSPTPPAAGEVTVAIAGCGVCHTDIGFLHEGVPTRQPVPLTLGHEISGTIVDLGPDAVLHQGDPLTMGQQVVVPAVLPCGTCSTCTSGRENMCPRQKMPGNDLDGGFATHITVPARFLVPVHEVPAGHHLAHLAVIADAVTTPFQALNRANVKAGDAVVIVGAGGIGIYGVQIAAALGARVIAVDARDGRTRQAAEYGASATVCVAGMDGKASRAAVRAAAAEQDWPRSGWKVFEMSGSPAGQELAYSLLSPGATLAIVGFTPKKVTVRLSNLMAFDADAFGSWGCRPQYYTDVLDLVTTGKVRIAPFVSFHALDEINSVLDQAHGGSLEARAVLIPGSLEDVS